MERLRISCWQIRFLCCDLLDVLTIKSFEEADSSYVQRNSCFPTLTECWQINITGQIDSCYLFVEKWMPTCRFFGVICWHCSCVFSFSLSFDSVKITAHFPFLRIFMLQVPVKLLTECIWYHLPDLDYFWPLRPYLTSLLRVRSCCYSSISKLETLGSN